MGVDLTLMPLLGKSVWCAHEMLGLERRRELWDKVAELPQQQIPNAVCCYVARDKTSGQPRYGDAEITPHGDKITYTTAADLLTLKDDESIQDNWKNKAIWAYLAQMPPDWPIVLWWH
jgi:hypothetical protein